MVERALGLLRDGSSVKAAALGAGFTDPAYFSRVFSRRYGVPPSRWREVDDDDVAETGSGWPELLLAPPPTACSDAARGEGLRC